MPIGHVMGCLLYTSKWMDNALHVSKVPAGSKGTHALPSGMSMGASIPLVPVESGKVEPGNREYTDPKMQDTGKIYFYWGCSEKVRSGPVSYTHLFDSVVRKST